MHGRRVGTALERRLGNEFRKDLAEGTQALDVVNFRSAVRGQTFELTVEGLGFLAVDEHQLFESLELGDVYAFEYLLGFRGQRTQAEEVVEVEVLQGLVLT
mmetsp:Transcript_33197/g.50878  ORF Transcript_33197/g.50878 Transcript_33197/m.50878 type:complete len:101 (-) Transcript_33197:495-797(-)|eukprot:CAMPEP_0170485844 /NCGR_PEP_ID=MMETSP0208-20121228/5004_1 /TAXON_ID=197538 /ORGANISM="Strombidium inclinatum, Strain S3" /LENGTH=100 /DNA_ID=CAMNT_0010759609 /DNA_START=3616 /DNA_END=3918 /DNA_ORIENTATION=-